MTFLCIASFFKGNEFLQGMKSTGATVYLLTSKHLEHEPWAREAIDDVFYIEADKNDHWHMPHVVSGLAYLMRSKKIDRVVALDDFDVEKAALIREEFRIPGMGQTTHRHFRDKLAMRVKAQEARIRVPSFSNLFHDADIQEFIDKNPAPWIVKPRSQASATGMKKVQNSDELWAHLHSLGEHRHAYLVEEFKPGAVYHVDALSYNGKMVFCRASAYLDTPFEVAHGGGIFRSATLAADSAESKELKQLTAEVMDAFGMQYSASHTEWIKNHADGKFYFLETASRVGGAHLSDMVEAATGINLWYEWAKMEAAVFQNKTYKMPKIRKDNAGIIVSLARQEQPDTSGFTDPEICWRMQHKKYHIGLIVQSKKRQRIFELLDDYAVRVAKDFHASVPAPENPMT